MPIHRAYGFQPESLSNLRQALFLFTPPNTHMNTYQVNNEGYYGAFGGAEVPEILRNNLHELATRYRNILREPSFVQEYRELLRDYVGRPSPLYHARRLSSRYNATIYLKREDLNHTGSHKINNALGQVLLARRLNKTRIIAETGAGQHGVATATACALLGLPCHIYMGSTDVERQHVNVERMHMLGATVHPVSSGSSTLTDAVDAAFADYCEHAADTFYVVGSAVGPHPYPTLVAELQSVISAEIHEQLQQKIGRDYPDHLVACIGGGSNAMGTMYHYLSEKRTRLLLAEAAGKGIASGQHAATLSVGKPATLHGAHTLVIQDSAGHPQEPYSLSAGLDYPGIGPLPAHLVSNGRAQVLAVTDSQAVAAARELTRLEGIIPALESAHALAALPHLQLKPTDVVVLTISGRGDKDLATYLAYPQ